MFLFLFSYALLFEFKQENKIIVTSVNQSIIQENSIEESKSPKRKGMIEIVLLIWMLSLIIEELKQVNNYRNLILKFLMQKNK